MVHPVPLWNPSIYLLKAPFKNSTSRLFLTGVLAGFLTLRFYRSLLVLKLLRVSEAFDGAFTSDLSTLYPIAQSKNVFDFQNKIPRSF